MFVVGGVCVLSVWFAYTCVCFVCHVLCDAVNVNCLFADVCVCLCVIQVGVLCVSFILRCCEMCC